MIVRLSVSAIRAFILFAVIIAVAHKSPAHGEHAPSYPQKACPTISVSCPSDFKDGEPLTFTASIDGGNPNVIPIYNWTVSVGKIIHGQGSSSITVDTIGFAGHDFTGTVSVAGFDLACPTAASCSLITENLLNSIKFDSYEILQEKKEASRLDPFARQLQNQPGDQGYLLVYGGRHGRAGEAKRAAARAQQYLVRRAGIDTRRIVTVDAGFKERLTIELWLVPAGATPPVAAPMAHSSEVKINKTVPGKPSKP